MSQIKRSDTPTTLESPEKGEIPDKIFQILKAKHGKIPKKNQTQKIKHEKLQTHHKILKKARKPTQRNVIIF